MPGVVQVKGKGLERMLLLSVKCVKDFNWSVSANFPPVYCSQHIRSKYAE